MKCACGCGHATNRVKNTHAARGLRAGDYAKYVKGHNRVSGTAKSYRMRDGKRAHVTVVEAVLGHALPKGAVVHHVNEDKHDNSHGNLVACQDATYHALLHTRQRALRACGNPSYRKCIYCKQYDDPAHMMGRTQDSGRYHQPCFNAYRREKRRRRQAERA